MSTTLRSVRALSAGAALFACSLAAAQGVPLQFSTVDAVSATVNLGSTTGTFSFTGPSTFMGENLTIVTGAGSGPVYAAHAPILGGYMDVFIVSLITQPNYYTAGFWTATFSLTLNQSVVFRDLGGAFSSVASWTLDSAAITDGAVVSAGAHVFLGTFVYNGSPAGSIGSGFGLMSAAAIPLPGAAGLAAVGLAGLSRRRRR